MTAPLPLNWPLVQAPTALLDWQYNWGPSPGSPGWLPVGDSIIASTFAVREGAITVASSSFTASAVTVWLQTIGLLGYCQVVNNIITAQGRNMSWTLTVKVENT
jgi:hypothetical protein